MENDIRFLGDLQRLEVRPGDKFVLTLDHHASESEISRAREILRSFFGDDRQVLVLSAGMTLGVVGGET